MRQTALKIIICIMILLTLLITPKQSPADTYDYRSATDTVIVPFIDRFLEFYSLPGFAISVVKGQKVIFAKGYGVQSVDEPAPVTLQTVFSTASVTKLFTGIAVMQLYDVGLVDINSPVSAYLPYFKLKDPRYRWITLKQMLSHTSGMPDIDAEELYSSWANPSFSDDALETYVRSLDSVELIADPGTEYSYSSMAYDVLAHLVAKISGETFEDYIAEHILNPLEMNNSSVDIRKTNKAQLASPHLLNQDLKFAVSDTMPYSRNHVGCGTLFSTVEDLSRFAIWILQAFQSDGERILSDSALSMMWTPVIQWSEQGSQGLSWIIWKDEDHILYEHSGGDPGYRCELIVVPEDSVAVIAMTNSWEHDITPITMITVRAMLGEHDNDCIEMTRGALWNSLRLFGADSAMALFTKINKTEDTDCLHPAHFNQFADMLMGLGRFDDACKLKEFNARAHSSIPVLRILLAEAYVQAENKLAALKVCREIIQDDPDNERALEIISQFED